jgi:hypothetical protein
MTKTIKYLWNVLLAGLTAVALALGAREAVASASDGTAVTYCTYAGAWNGPCGSTCNSSCISQRYPGGICTTYNHPTKGPIPCCLCGGN